MFYEVIPAKFFERAHGTLTYRSDLSLLPGQIVSVPLGRSTVLAVVYKKVTQPDFPTKPISGLLYSAPLPRHLLHAMHFIADYYQVSPATALTLMLPSSLLTKSRKTKTKPEQTSKTLTSSMAGTEQNLQNPLETLKIPEIHLTTAQQNAVKALQNAPGCTKLLFGLTGSGKTHIYLSEAARALKAQKSTILLVPEIALTSQLVRVFGETFGNRIVLIHSGQTPAQRRQTFAKLLESTEPLIIIGPRSALFAPIKNLGCIIVDEEHESAYFQESAPKYSAVRVASAIAKDLKIPCILGSATPSITDYHVAKAHDSLVALTEKALSTATAPDIHLIDLKNRDAFSKNRYFSTPLLKAIEKNLETHRQTLIFHNRRGSAPLTLCEKCGYEFLCPHCFLPLTLHADRYELVCHTCDYHIKVPTSCPECGTPGIVHKGFGSKLLENELGNLFPKAHIRRFDADNKKSETLAESYEAVRAGDVDILVGTQTLAKGLDLPLLTTVGVVQADAGLSLPDFAAEERAFQLLTQVIGRVGRGHQDQAEVFIQTFRPEHPLFDFALHADFPGFAAYALERRKAGGFPPYLFVADCQITLKTEALVVKKIRALARRLASNKKLLLSPPMPAFHERTARGYTWRLVVRSRSRAHLVAALGDLDPAFHITLDPPSLL